MTKINKRALHACILLSSIFATSHGAVCSESKVQDNCHKLPAISRLTAQLNAMAKMGRPQAENWIMRNDWFLSEGLSVDGKAFSLSEVSGVPSFRNLWGRSPFYQTVYLSFPLDPKNISPFETRGDHEGNVFYTFMHKNPVTEQKCLFKLTHNPNDHSPHKIDQVESYNFLYADRYGSFASTISPE